MMYCSVLERKEKVHEKRGLMDFTPVYFKHIVIGNILVKLAGR